MGAPDIDKLLADQTAREVPLTSIKLGKNVRGELGDLSKLKISIKAKGVLQPIILSAEQQDGKWLLVAGYRRFAVAKELKLATVPAVYIAPADLAHLEAALIENMSREDMNAMDKARGLEQLIRVGVYDQKTAADIVGISEGAVSQLLSLLKLPAKIQKAVEMEKIEMSHARQLVRVKDTEDCLAFLTDLLAEGWTATDLQNRVDLYLQKLKDKEAKVAAATEAAERKAIEKEARESNGPAEVGGGGGGKSDADSDEDGDRDPDQKQGTGSDVKSLAEQYVDCVLDPLGKKELRDTLALYAGKLERAESPEKRLEWKFTLRGIEIAAGLQKPK
jgi:ParB/RepB/Spo0J family partition protein